MLHDKELILEAACFADNAHRGQTRRYGGVPYIVHPMRVAGMVSLHVIADAETVAAAWLHDTLEDTAVTLEALRTRFGVRVASLVLSLTGTPPTPGMNREERKRADREKLVRAPYEAKVIKLFDRLDNLEDAVRELSTVGTTRDDWYSLYSKESVLLVEAIGSVDRELSDRIFDLAKAMGA